MFRVRVMCNKCQSVFLFLVFFFKTCCVDLEEKDTEKKKRIIVCLICFTSYFLACLT